MKQMKESSHGVALEGSSGVGSKVEQGSPPPLGRGHERNMVTSFL